MLYESVVQGVPGNLQRGRTSDINALVHPLYQTLQSAAVQGIHCKFRIRQWLKPDPMSV